MKLVVMISIVLATWLQGAHIDVFVLTGQSNALGTTAGGEADTTPGADPADQKVKFFWSNRATASLVIGDSNGTFTTMQAQQGGYYSGSSTHWGPEIGFARSLFRAGVRDFAVVKAARGGGGNTFWFKDSSDDHMYDHVVATVQAATNQLVAQGHTFSIKGLLYLQGESDSVAEAQESGVRLKALVDQLRADLPNAGSMHCVCGGIAAPGATRDVVRTQQESIATATDYIDFFSNTDLQSYLYDNLHFNKAAKIAVGERFAQSFFAASVISRHYGKLVFVGDSITQGGNGRPSFRYEVFKHLARQQVNQGTVNGYRFTGSVTGAYQSNPGPTPDAHGQTFSNVHEGHYGWRASWINGRVALPSDRRSQNRGEGTLRNWTNQLSPQQYAISNPTATVSYPDTSAVDTGNTGITYIPDTVCLMVGVNDLGDNNSAAIQVRDDLSTIIDQLRAANPLVRIHLCEVLPTNQTAAMATGIQTLNGLLPALVAAKNISSTTSPVWLVPVHAGFDAASMTYDNVHPNAAGEAHVGQRVAESLGLLPPTLAASTTTTVVSESLDSSDFASIHLGHQIWGSAGYRNTWFESGSLTESITAANNFRVTSGSSVASWFEGTKTGWSAICAGSWSAEIRLKCHANPNGFVMWFGIGGRRIIVEVMNNATRDNGINTFNESHNNLDGQFHTFRVVHDAVNAKYHVFRDGSRVTPVSGVNYDATATDNRFIFGDFTSGTFGNNFDVEIESIRYTAGAYLPVDADLDADGLFDAWEWKWYASFTAALPAGDDDGDGFSNIQEQTDSSDPWNPNSYGTQSPSGSVQKTSQTIPRFGRHELLQLVVSNPTAQPIILNSLDLQFKNQCESLIARAVLLDNGAVPETANGTILAETTDPASSWQVVTNLTIPPGRRYLRIMIEPERYAPLNAVIDGFISGMTIGSIAVTPDPQDPPGRLTLGLVPMISDVVKSGDLGIHTFRIPGIVTDRNGTLHAVYDHRYDSSADLPGNIDVGYSRSEDGGVTWSPSRVILDFDATVVGSSGNGVGDPSILYDPVTDTLWTAALWSQGNRAYNGSGPGLTPAETAQYVLTKSSDGGITWSAPINITSQVKDPAWRLLFCAPGHGIALRNGTLVFPSQMRRESDGLVRKCFIFSSDHGETWQFGSVIPDTSPQTNENEALELDDGRLLFSSRTPSGSNGQRAWSHFTPGGTQPLKNGTWAPLFRLAEVPDPVCQASIIQWKSQHTGHPREWILFSNPAGGGRTGGTIRLSQNGGITWPHARLLYSGSFAYSCLTILNDGSIGVLFERDDYTKISFARVEEGWLLRHDLDADGDQIPDAWETMQGLNPASAADGGIDGDGDGSTNRHEYLAATDPSNASSVLRISELSRSGASSRLKFSAVPRERYGVEQSENLLDWQPAGSVMADQAEMTILLPGATSARRFFRIRRIP